MSGASNITHKPETGSATLTTKALLCWEWRLVVETYISSLLLALTCYVCLTPRGRGKLVFSLQTTFANSFYWITIILFHSIFQGNLCPVVLLSYHKCRQCVEADAVTNPDLNRLRPSLLMYICATQPGWVHTFTEICRDFSRKKKHNKTTHICRAYSFSKYLQRFNSDTHIWVLFQS